MTFDQKELEEAIKDVENVYSRQGTARIGSKVEVCKRVQGIVGPCDGEGTKGYTVEMKSEECWEQVI